MLKVETNGAANIIMLIDLKIKYGSKETDVELLMKIRKEAVMLEAYIKELGNASKEGRANLMWHELKERMKNG